MSPNPFVSGLSRRTMLSALAMLPTFSRALLPVPIRANGSLRRPSGLME